MAPEVTDRPLLISVKTAARLLCVSEPHVYKMACDGRLPAIRWEAKGEKKISKRTVLRFTREDIFKFIESHRTGGEP
jgi:excisionase family DNA binding protein